MPLTMDIMTRKSRCYEETCRRLRNGLIRESSVSADDSLPLVVHSDVLKQLRAELVDDNPPHIVFPGSKDSYIQVSAEFPCPRSYTASFWIKVDEDSEIKAFLLCRCRSPTGGIDFVLRDRQADGKWSVIVQALTDNNSNPAAEKQEIKDALYISPGRWHLVAIRHQTAFIRSPHLSVIVDGKLEFEQPLGYPFSSSSVQSQWVFGLGFKGIMSSISLYTEEVSNNMLALLYHQGPHTPSLSHSVVGVPQSSFDTGHIMLGTLIAKGPLASASSKVTAAFCITPQHLLPAANLFQVWAGKQNVDHIEMTMHFPDEYSVEDHPLIPTIAGSCGTSLVDGVDSLPSCAAAWSAAGGCSLAVYLISEYVTAANAQLSADESTRAASTSSSTKDTKAADLLLVKESMLLLADLVRASGDLKEQFVQTHGFHLVGRSLAQIQNKYHSIDKGLVDCCFDLTLALGIDLEKGDGVAAALQGLLFNFSIWGDCNEAVKLHLMNGLANIVDLSGEQMYRSLGMQRIVDALRIHIFAHIDRLPSSKSALSAAALVDSHRKALFDGVGEAIATASPGELALLRMDCADAAARLLNLVIDAALAHSQKFSNATASASGGKDGSHNLANASSKTPFYLEAEILLHCLEETSSSLLAERILRATVSLRSVASTALLRALVDSRFCETSAVALLTKRNMSPEVRRETICSVLWALGESLKNVPGQLLQMRKSLIGTGASLSMKGDSRHANILSRAGLRGGANNSNTPGRNKDVKAPQLPKEFQLMQSEIRSIVRPLEKAWLTTTMLGEVLARALKDGCWDDVDNYSELGLRKEIDIDLDKCSIVVVDDENGYGNESQSPKRGKEQAGEQGYNGREEAKGKTSLSNGANSTVNDILAVLTHDGPLGIVHSWLLLPLLPVLLTHGSFRSSQRALMSLNVLLKTDEGQCATLSALPDRSWVRLFVATALISERGRLSALAQADSLKKKAVAAAEEPAGSDPTAQSDLLTPTSGSETGADIHNSPKLTVSSSFGSVSRWGLMTEEDWRVEAEVAATSAELALDSVATVLESKMRYSGPFSWSAWNCLQNCLKSGCKALRSEAEATEMRFLKRCVSLVLQRLARSSEDWSPSVLDGVVNILKFIENRRLCGNIPYQPPLSIGSSLAVGGIELSKAGTKKGRSNAANTFQPDDSVEVNFSEPMATIDSLIRDTKPVPPPPLVQPPLSPNSLTALLHREQQPDELQIMCFLIDLLHSLRRITKRGTMNPGDEHKPMRVGLQVLLGCLRSVSESGADRISNEIMAQLSYLSEAREGNSTELMKEFVLFVFSKLQDVVLDPSTPEPISGRYSATVYSFMHHFLDLRHNIASGVAVSPHMLPVIDDMAAVDTCNDVKTIFRLLEVSLRTADTISFDDDPEESVDDSASNAVSSPGASYNTLPSPAQPSTFPQLVDTDAGNASESNLSVGGADAAMRVPFPPSQLDDLVIVQSEDASAPRGTDGSEIFGSMNSGAVSVPGEAAPKIQVEVDLLDFTDMLETSTGIGTADSPFPAAAVESQQGEIPNLAAGNTAMYGPDETEALKSSSAVEQLLDVEGALAPPVSNTPEQPTNVMASPTLSLKPVVKVDDSVHSSSVHSDNSPRQYEEIEGAVSKLSGISENEDEISKEKNYLNWLKIRSGILADRVDSERARMTRAAQALELAAEAVDKQWRRVKRKVETESFYDSHKCQWKLGIAHEGFFPGHKRVALRPRYDVQPEEPSPYGIDRVWLGGHHHHHLSSRSSDGDLSSLPLVAPEVPTHSLDELGSPASTSRSLTLTRHSSLGKNSADLFGDVSSPMAMSSRDLLSASIDMGETEDIRLALAKACAGHITDVTRSESIDAPTISDPVAVNAPTIESSHAAEQKQSSPGRGGGAAQSAAPPPLPPPPALSQSAAAGSGWRLVDADDSEEGYGVVGLESVGNNGYSDELGAALGAGSKASAQQEGRQDNGTEQLLPAFTVNDSGEVTIDESLLPPPPPLNDMMGDLRLVEEAIREGRGIVETGPCMSGTRRAGNGGSIVESRVILITASGNVWGTLAFNSKELFFTSSLEPENGHKDDSAAVNLTPHLRMRRRRWTISAISAIYLRRYRLRDTALEIFFRRGKHRNFFVDFGHTREDEKLRIRFARALMDIAPQTAFKQWPSLPQFRLVPEVGVQEKWLSGQISNFDYLMALNTISGRSFNDLCQYPVMPWVLAKYEDPTIDLSDPASYRDLSKPVGALNEARLKEFLERFYSFEDQSGAAGGSTSATGTLSQDSIPPFMYGSHYSTMVGVVLHFLVRLQPFAALHKEMQNGHFDVPDRLFSSIPRSYRHNTTQLSEVKELTPEWFSTPEMFRNVNNFDFGVTQDGERIGDVELPPWARSPEEFVRINREALESDYVSEHLHEWIDLIFGFKQRGPAAVEARNVFYYLTYSGSVNRDVMVDENVRRATELQIAHFGQIPMQLFNSPHPAKRIPGRVNPSQIATPRPLSKCFILPQKYSNPFGEPYAEEEIEYVSAGQKAAITENGNTQQQGTEGDPQLIEVGDENAAATAAGGTQPLAADPLLFLSDLELPSTAIDSVIAASAASPDFAAATSIGTGASSVLSHRESDAVEVDSVCVADEEFTYGFRPPLSDEEAIALGARCTVVQRPFAATLSLSAPTVSSFTVDYSAAHLSDGGDGEDLRSYIKVVNTAPMSVPPGLILSVSVHSDRLICVMGSGVVESYKYSTSEVAKTALAAAAALPPQHRRIYGRRKHLQKIVKRKPETGISTFSPQSDASRTGVSVSPVDDRGAAVDLSPTVESAEGKPQLQSTASPGANASNADLNAIHQLNDQPLISFDDDEPSQAAAPPAQKNESPDALVASAPRKNSATSSSTSRSGPPARARAASSSDTWDRVPESGAVKLSHPRLMPAREALVAVERDGAHFRVLPRVPLSKVFYRRDIVRVSDESNSSSTGSASGAVDLTAVPPLLKALRSALAAAQPQFTLEQAAEAVVFTRSGRLALCSGFVDGSIAVRELDTRTGFVLGAADFRAHRNRVICVSSASIPTAHTDVVASCDAFGQTLVWTISRMRNIPTGTSNVVLSRRPQRIFRCRPSTDMRCDVSMQIGVVAVASCGVISVFSIERDERLRAFEISLEPDTISNETNKSPDASAKATERLQQQQQEGAACVSKRKRIMTVEERMKELHEDAKRVKRELHGLADTGCLSSAITAGKGSSGYQRKSSPAAITSTLAVVRRVALTDDGIIVVHVVVEPAAFGRFHEPDAAGPVDGATSLRDTPAAVASVGNPCRTKHLLLSYTLSGSRTGYYESSSPITFMALPDRSGDVLITGHEDGGVMFFRSSDLLPVYGPWYPHSDCVPQNLDPNASSLPPISAAGGKGKQQFTAADVGATTYQQLKQSEATSAGVDSPFEKGVPGVSASPIVCVRAGPNPLSPAVICVTSAAGYLYVKALPDFVRWERTRTPSALAQLVTAPLQAVRGTIQQAQHLGTYASETYGVLRDNAKSFVDETLGELKKINKSKVLNFFGFGKSDK